MSREEILNEDLKRLEIAWECIRRGDQFKKYYSLQKTMLDYKSKANKTKFWKSEQVREYFKFIKSEWGMVFLPDPRKSFLHHQKHLKEDEFDLSFRGLLGVLWKQAGLQLESDAMKRVIFPEKHGKASQKDAESLGVFGFRNVKLSFNLYTSHEKLIAQFRKLLNDMRKKVNHDSGPRKSDIDNYLRVYDQKKSRRLKYTKNDDANRALRDRVQNARELINGGWRFL